MSPKAFTRNCKLTFPNLIFFMSNLLKCSLQKELNTFFKTLNNNNFPTTFITKGAFTKARKKISHNAFIELNNELLVGNESIFPLKRDGTNSDQESLTMLSPTPRDLAVRLATSTSNPIIWP